MSTMEKKIQVDENGCEYILFTIDVYFTEYLSAVEIEILFLRRKDKKYQKNNLVVNLLELMRVKKAIMQTMKPTEYKHLLVKLNTELKKLEKESNKKMKELKDENKELKCKNKELKDRIKEIKDKIKKLTNQSVYVVKNILPNYKK